MIFIISIIDDFEKYLVNLLIALLLSIASLNTFASTAKSSITISCHVVRSGYVKVDDTCISTNISTPVPPSTHEKLVRDLNISCPKGTNVELNYHLTVYNKDANSFCDLPINNKTDIKFYRDAQCSELWKSDKALQIVFTDSGQIANVPIYCRLNQDQEIKSSEDQTIIMVLTMSF